MPLSAKSKEFKLLLVGIPDPVHVGAHLKTAAKELSINCMLADIRNADRGSELRRKIHWRLFGHRPTGMRRFNDEVFETCRAFLPNYLIATGLVPLTQETLRRIGQLGIQRGNYLTDDPWNPAHKCRWFLNALTQYDVVYTPRTENVRDLQAHGCSHVLYVPFAYAPQIHYLEDSLEESIDLAFIGGADSDRVPMISELLNAGIKVSLYGGYWDRFTATKSFACGMATAEMARRIASFAKVSLCLVRRANRDQSCMRTFELPAMGACIVAEDTEEHRRFYGPDGEVVHYFSNSDQMVQKVKWLLSNPQIRARMRANAAAWVVQNRHTYADRLNAMLANVDLAAEAVA
jgi:hypothetical protein